MNKKIVIQISIVIILILFVIVIKNNNNNNQIIKKNEPSFNIKNLPTEINSTMKQIHSNTSAYDLSKSENIENKTTQNPNLNDNLQLTETETINKLQSQEEFVIVDGLNQILSNPNSYFIPFVLPLLKSSSSTVSELAIKTLGIIGAEAEDFIQKDIIKQMKQMLDDDMLKNQGDNLGLQIFVYEALGDLLSTEGLSILESAITQIENLAIQRAVIDSIGKIKQKSSIPSLIKYRVLLQKHKTENDFNQELKVELLEFINNTISLI